MPFEACCPGVKYPGDDCPPVWGSCGHAFHMQWYLRLILPLLPLLLLLFLLLQLHMWDNIDNIYSLV